MNNLHNPIAVRVQRVQELWLKQSTAYPQVRVFVLRYEPSDAPLIEGFLALEPTEHGLSDDTFLLFRVSLNSTEQLLKAIPKSQREELLIVSESGYHSKEDIVYAENLGIDALLIGEALMKGEIF